MKAIILIPRHIPTFTLLIQTIQGAPDKMLLTKYCFDFITLMKHKLLI